jgi:AraC family transcriptional regulator
MNKATEVPTVWNQLAEAMYLKDSPTAEVKLSEHACFSFGRFQNSVGLPEIARPITGQDGFLVALQLKAIPLSSNSSGGRRYRVVLILSVESVQLT